MCWTFPLRNRERIINLFRYKSEVVQNFNKDFEGASQTLRRLSGRPYVNNRTFLFPVFLRLRFSRLTAPPLAAGCSIALSNARKTRGKERDCLQTARLLTICDRINKGSLADKRTAIVI